MVAFYVAIIVIIVFGIVLINERFRLLGKLVDAYKEAYRQSEERYGKNNKKDDV